MQRCMPSVYRSVHQRVPSQQGVPAPLRTGEVAFADNVLALTFSLFRSHACPAWSPVPGPASTTAASASASNLATALRYARNCLLIRTPNLGSIWLQCQEPCDRKLQCGHACVGLCGERCPPCAQPGCGGDRKEFFDDTMLASKYGLWPVSSPLIPHVLG